MAERRTLMVPKIPERAIRPGENEPAGPVFTAPRCGKPAVLRPVGLRIR